MGTESRRPREGARRRPALHAAAFALVLSASLLVGSCGPLARDRVAYEEEYDLGDGEAKIYQLSSGRYRLNLTARAEEVSVEWIGGGCPRTDHTAALETTCEVTGEGQLVVRNPPEHGSGGPAQLTLRVTRLARKI